MYNHKNYILFNLSIHMLRIAVVTVGMLAAPAAIANVDVEAAEEELTQGRQYLNPAEGKPDASKALKHFFKAADLGSEEAKDEARKLFKPCYARYLSKYADCQTENFDTAPKYYNEWYDLEEFLLENSKNISIDYISTSYKTVLAYVKDMFWILRSFITPGFMVNNFSLDGVEVQDFRFLDDTDFSHKFVNCVRLKEIDKTIGGGYDTSYLFFLSIHEQNAKAVAAFSRFDSWVFSDEFKNLQQSCDILIHHYEAIRNKAAQKVEYEVMMRKSLSEMESYECNMGITRNLVPAFEKTATHAHKLVSCLERVKEGPRFLKELLFKTQAYRNQILLNEYPWLKEESQAQ